MKTFSMQWIRLRCDRDEDTGCLLWKQHVSKTGAPVATKRSDDGRKPAFQIRRVVWEHKNGPIPCGMVVTCSCGKSRCLSHLELITKAEVIRRQWQRPDLRAKLLAGMTKAGRARVLMTIEKAREIRASNDTLKVAAEKHGISISLASMIRRNIRWKEEANPFAGLFAMNDGERKAA